MERNRKVLRRREKNQVLKLDLYRGYLMKKQNVIIITVIIFIAAGIYGLKLISKYQSKSYVFAEELQKQGLAINNITIEGSTNIVDQVMATGDGLKIKVTHYGNALFLENVVNSLERDKKKQVKIESAPIYAVRDLIIVVYQEPVPGQVKEIVSRLYPGVREY